jgi:hypothetical protein
MKAGWLATSVIACSLLAAGPLAGQRTRDELIQRARHESNTPARLDLLLRAADPAVEPRDSLWAVGVFDLAEALILEDHDAQGAIWLRWAARHAGRWPIDRDHYASSTVLGYDRALPAVRTTGGLGTPSVTTTWRWPASFDQAAEGKIEVANANAAVPIEVTVAGHGALATGTAMPLAPASYEVTASAPGHETVRVTREVLPGVTTVVHVDLPPVLPVGSSEKVASALVTVRYREGRRQVCTNGLITARDGLVLTTSALDRSTDVQIETSAGVFDDVSVAAVDAALGLAVLRLRAPKSPAPTVAGSVADRQYAWALYHSGCHGAASARTRIAGWRADGQGAAGLSPALPLAASGGPLFDRRGQLIGVVTGPEQVVPLRVAERLLDRAATQRPVVAETAPPIQPQVPSAGPRLPWRWIGAGAAAVGVAAAILTGSFGDGGGGPSGPETGGIKITLPGGGSP